MANQATVKLNLLTEKQIKQVHEAALRILEKTGTVVTSERAVKLLKDAGAKCEGDRVRFPSKLVEKALKTRQSMITVYDREGKPVMHLGDRNNYFGTGSDCINVYDPQTRKHRETKKADVIRIARLCDALKNIDFCMSMGVATDKSRVTSYVHQFEGMAKSTAKTLVFTADGEEDMKDIFAIASIIVGGEKELLQKPRYVLYNEPISPLQHTRMGMEKMLFAAEHNVPMIYIPSPMMGGTAPVTMAGCVAQSVAEGLSGLVIHQLCKPGAPFIFGADATIFDMREMIFAYGAPELQIMDMAMADMAHYYGLPLFCIAGATDSKVVDAQAGAEMALSLLVSALNGCNIIHDVGYLESGIGSSLESVVLADELIGTAKRYVAGFEINDETLALDVIDKVGPQKDFLNEDHTLENFRKDVWFPKRFNRQQFSPWEKAGSLPVNEVMYKEGLELLESQKPPVLSKQQNEGIEKVLARR
jgi:trimethylamine---corrinoid protein Co-methyltransferase